MQVRILEFDISIQGAYSLDEYASKLSIHNQGQFTYGNFNRILKIKSNKNMASSLIVTIKMQDQFYAIEETKSGFILNKNTLKANNSIADFNFFTIDTASGFGLYQYYHHSLSINDLSRVLQIKYNELINGDTNIIDKDEALSRSRITVALRATKESFSEILGTMSHISSFEFDYNVHFENQKDFRALVDCAEVIKHKVSFRRKLSLKERRDAIISAILPGNIQKGKAKCRDNEGIEHLIYLSTNPAVESEIDFNQFAKDTKVEIDKFEESEMSKYLADKISAK